MTMFHCKDSSQRMYMAIIVQSTQMFIFLEGVNPIDTGFEIMDSGMSSVTEVS